MSLREREETILRLIRQRDIGTQAELVEALRSEGIQVTQATVSRDVKRLGLAKVRDGERGARYAPSIPGVPANGRNGGPGESADQALRSTVAEFATGVVIGQAVLAIHTLSGCANAVAVAIDDAQLPGVVATLAGDDTIFVLTRHPLDRDRLREEIEGLMA